MCFTFVIGETRITSWTLSVLQRERIKTNKPPCRAKGTFSAVLGNVGEGTSLVASSPYWKNPDFCSCPPHFLSLLYSHPQTWSCRLWLWPYLFWGMQPLSFSSSIAAGKVNRFNPSCSIPILNLTFLNHVHLFSHVYFIWSTQTFTCMYSTHLFLIPSYMWTESCVGMLNMEHILVSSSQ